VTTTVQRSGLFRAALASGRLPVLGTWVKIPATETLELVALAGFDFVVIDLEHSPLGLESVSRLISTATLSGMAPLVRVPGHDVDIAQRLLDAGAEGIVVPHVDTLDQAHAVVAGTRFPPLGSRGVGSTSRAGQWGAMPREEYLRFGREEVVVIAQIESAVGVSNASAIAAVDGIDALLIGAADLAVSEQAVESDPAVVELIERIVRAGAANGVPVGTAGPATAAAVRAAAEAGLSFTMLSNDASLFGAATRTAVETARTEQR
jgi:2-keto-3-deoxy-L-rhamnonate aldolase RhmA